MAKQGQNSGGPHQGVIGSNYMRRPVILNLFAGWGVPEPQCSMLSPFIVQCLFLGPLARFLYENDIRKPLVNAELIEFVIKRRSANH